MTPGIGAAGLNSLVSLRIGDDEADYPSRIEGVDADTVVVAAPVGAPAALLESGQRDIELSWLSPRGWHRQRCALAERIASRPRLWRLRPTTEPELLQRRRFARARAAIPVVVVLPGAAVPGVTVDLSEGGLRLRIDRLEVEVVEQTPVRIQVTLPGDALVLPAHVVRATNDHDQTELVVMFDTESRETDAIRRFVFELQLRSRAALRA
jgi:c-di-GMP-binding flagellar brake protein YcgR